ncbi:type IX secretion system membrane protein PorP/SprF [Mariniflexile sp. AS56]|uniref:PorP/SprF family type IX secretion system membrane protein n=1 Tax=Mariniflexile sp. AS56 TaxID=3063957 RepID=UPI0026E95765|nr:type IX secretion system membrane protein PorP/SprF [Mariniflexile sp. AS56]MDO7174222.1 type IX secretion system membrane protein PorP/SprF [Mariniflexile sp. AS56]
MIHKLVLKGLTLAMFVLLINTGFAQQNPQYTQYMYNTMSVNPAYTGQRDVLSITGLYRTQWVGIDGAPKTQTFSAHSPLRNEKIGLGLSVVNDALGPATENYIDANFSYTILLNHSYTKLSFGVKAGIQSLQTDWSKGRYKNPDAMFNENLSLFSPTIGTGLYLHNQNWYLGVAIPNFLTTKHYDDFQESVASERLHYYAIAGYVFDINDQTKLKPAALVKAVSGAPIIADLSANLLLRNKFTLGLAYRWDDAFSGLLGFQVSNGLYIGYAYDATTTKLNNYNSGSHEIMLRFELQKLGRIISPRFF